MSSAASSSSSQAVKHTCGYCHNQESQVSFKVCSGCRSVYYCSPEHQKEDWKKNHKAACAIISCISLPIEQKKSMDIEHAYFNRVKKQLDKELGQSPEHASSALEKIFEGILEEFPESEHKKLRAFKDACDSLLRILRQHGSLSEEARLEMVRTSIPEDLRLTPEQVVLYPL